MARSQRTATREPGGSPSTDPKGLHPGKFQPERQPAARAARIAALSWLLVAGMASHGHALPGQLDPNFAGLSSVSVGQNVMCHAMAPDGKIVLAGNNGDDPVIARRLSNGDPDYSFSGDGRVVVTNLGVPVVTRSVAVQADGRIVVAGYTNETFGRRFVIRLTASGSNDPTFSGDGIITIPYYPNSYYDTAEKVLIQPDGKIVVVGSSAIDIDWDFAAVRLHSDGTLDMSFSGDGQAAVGFGGDDLCYDAVLQADGKLVMVGGTEAFVSADEDFAIARLHPDGSPDNSFDGDGELKTGFGDVEAAYAVAIQPSDLRIVVAGRGKAARYYSSDGSLDDSFDGDGKLSIAITAYDAAITPGGKIALIGIAGTEARALRLNSNGSLDSEWQTDGDVIVDFDVLEPPSLSLLADGRVLTVVPKGADCLLRQYWADGYLDTGGRQAAAFDDATFRPGSREIAYDLAVQADGRIVLAGEVATAAGTERDFALVRFLPDGRLDTSFGVNGRTALSLGNVDIAKAVALQPDGKFVVAGHTGTGNAANFMIARFNADGSVDNTFGFGGFNAMDFLGGPDYAWAIALAPDGRIIVAGTVFNGARSVFGVACFNSNGTANTAFDLDGKQLYEFSVGPAHSATSVVIQGGTRIIVGGNVGADWGLVAFTMTGALDNTFGSSGRVTRNLGGNDYLNALALGPDGMIYGAGGREIGGNMDFALARWSSNGSLPLCPIGGCSNTWTDARAFVDWGATSGWVDALDIRSDGSIAAAGYVGTGVRFAQFSPTSSTPILTSIVDYPGSDDGGLAAKFTGANRLLVAGYHTFQSDRNMTLSCFEVTANTTVGVRDPEEPRPTMRLHAPAPNPLVGRSTFTFELPRTQSVRLAIHDVSGRQVRMLMDGELPAGSHQGPWDGTDDQGRSVAAGVYFARLVVGAEHATASIVVLR